MVMLRWTEELRSLIIIGSDYRLDDWGSIPRGKGFFL
jgi:hypothetical protein